MTDRLFMHVVIHLEADGPSAGILELVVMV